MIIAAKSWLASTVAVAAFGLSAVSAQALTVNNGGFETGDFTGWVQGGDTGYSYVFDSSILGNPDGLPLFAGSYSAAFGPLDSIGTLSQSFSVVPGATYKLSFYLSNYFGAGGPSSFSVTLGSSSFALPDDFPDFGYGKFSLSTVAASSTLGLTFSFHNEPGYWLLDDVSVAGPSPVPEPATLALMIAGIGVVGSLAKRRRLSS
jgi:hypothetical protein